MRFRLLLPVMMLSLAFFLSGCSEKDGPTGADDGDGALAAGHYLLHEEKDGLAGLEQYLAILPGSKWESTDYWISNTGAVIGLSRTRGNMSLKNDSLVLVEVESGETVEKRPITQADFDGYVWEASPVGTAQALRIRNVTSASFEATDFTHTNWQTFYRQSDPHGFFD